MQCYVCGETNWHSMPKEVNHQKRNFQVCMTCGNMAYNIEPQEENELREFYRKDYRSAPTTINLITTTHKLNYIKIFLADFLKDKKGLMVGDIGCATGYLVNWFAMNGHKATGSEWTINYRRFCEHFYGIPITEELETKHKYDLLVMYHTLEHFAQPDKKIEHYMSLLKDGGHMLISCPKWLDTIEEFGGGEWKSIDHYFHPNHINIFTETSIKNLFRRFGLKIVKEDHLQYGQTYLLQKGGPIEEIVKEDWQEIEKQVLKIKEASELYAKKDFKGATTVWPKFVEAWTNLIFNVYTKEPESQEDLFKEAFEKSGLADHTKMRMSRAVWLYQQQRYEEAEKEFEWLINLKPNEDILMYRGWALANLKRYNEAKECIYRAQVMNPQKWVEAMNWLCNIAVQQPAWDERAAEELKEKLFKEHMEKQNG